MPILTLIYSGRAHRSAQNSRLYQRNQLSVTIPTLPDTLLTYSTAFLRKTSLFDLYHKLIDTEPFAMDLMDYAHLSTPTYNITSEQALLDLCHSINGRQLNLLEAEGDRRYKESVNRFREVTEMARNDLQHASAAFTCDAYRILEMRGVAQRCWRRKRSSRRCWSWHLTHASFEYK